RIEGVATEIVRGMPFTVKASAINPAQRVTIGINGDTKAFKVANANVTVPAVLEDLDITILVQDADAGDYLVYNISEGQLASKLADECPARLKLVGSMFVSDFNALRDNASTIIDLDLSEVTIKGAMMTGNQLPENAFAPSSSSSLSSLKTVILPNNLERIDKNAFARCTQISEITIPANVNYIGAGAFSACVGLKKIIAKPKVAPTCGNTSPFPSNPSSISLEVPKGSEESYSVPSTWWAMLSLYKVPVEHKDYYWVKLDQSRVGVNGYKGDINNVAVGQKDEVTITLVLPNSQSEQFKPYDHVRPGVPFKVFDNGIDVLSNSYAYSKTGSGTPITPEQSWSMVGGLMLLRWNPSATSGVTMPQNHNIELNFYYDIKFENKEGAQGVKAEIVEVPEGSAWKDVLMRNFKYMSDNGWQANSEVKPVLYKEGSEIKFQLSDIPEKTVPVVTLKTKVMTKTGYSPEYEEKEMTLEANSGIYTIPALEGDCWISISGETIFEEGDLIPSDYLDNMDKEEAVSFNELAVSGDMSDEQFEQVRENFDNLEIIDLTAIENTALPENAFEGMDQLIDVIVSDNVTEIGAGCFKDCSSIESLTLPGVTSIGEGAFEGCESLTSILLPSLGASAAGGKPGMYKAGEIEGVNAESFRGLSPNCLIYIGENEIPGTEGLNIILNKNGMRVAASDITLDGNHPFNAPASFMLGDHKISFTADVASSLACDVNDGWTTIMLPFQPTSVTIGEQFPNREGSGLHILSFDDEESEVLTEQMEFLPNRPYLANVAAPFSTVPVTFTAVARQQDGDEVIYDVPFTPVPEETVAVGKEFSLYGSYDGQTRPVACYMLNEQGSTFVSPVDAAKAKTVKPFSAYLTANYATDKAEIEVGEHPIWVMDPQSAGVTGTKLYRSNKIELESLTKRATVYYTVDGSDPALADGSRKIYSEPITMESESMTLMAIAEYKDYVSDSVTLNFELKKSNIDYALEGEWHWISHNVENPVAVAEFAASGIDGILSQTQEVIFDSKHGMVGALTELLPTEGYKVRLSGDSWNGNVSGVSFDPVKTVKLNKGWNWIGTPVDEGSLMIADLFASVDAEEGDMLVGLDGSVQADAEGVWKGTISHMAPGVGYMFYSNSEKEFVYNIVAVHDSNVPAMAPVVAANGLWTVDNHKYASVMPVIASIDALGDVEDYQVAAFCGDECRGIGKVVDGVFMINVHGNAGDVIAFRFIGNDSEEMLSATTVVFNQNPEGTFANPFIISSNGATSVSVVNAESIGVAYEDGSFIIGGDMSDVRSVEIYDLTGKMIAKSNGERTIKVGNIDGSVVTVVVRKADSVSSTKLIVK
ncbi:MAG: leucine-rich repeat protein, partial [Muribaculaceae bacterium]|nr:leucine-rich repeat protein [Muribaculaceae bacterium]